MNQSLILLMLVFTAGVVVGMYLHLRATRPPTSDREQERHEREVQAAVGLALELLTVVDKITVDSWRARSSPGIARYSPGPAGAQKQDPVVSANRDTVFYAELKARRSIWHRPSAPASSIQALSLAVQRAWRRLAHAH